MSRRIQRFLPNDTAKFSWVDSGTTLTNGFLAVENDQGTIVSSMAMADSGNGHYYAFYTTAVGSDGYYVGEMGGDIGGYPYRRRVRFQVNVFEVD